MGWDTRQDNEQQEPGHLAAEEGDLPGLLQGAPRNPRLQV
eukprot:CAMPEP_0171916590 /NCGR_PEP_ID=MMETSP0993-20121228/15048_1 /TAXON_ID=483369 /ORGANISM="non described non described, Strain CCMP2098" /LENGTH=39 /DNA_ID= /DNA_START= /DNA_END= /DNA_ORIENTATION=